MLESQKHVFWQSLIITIAIFGIGILIGVIFENWRTNKLDFMTKQSDIDLLDIKVQSDIYENGYYNCNNAIGENLRFADKIYNQSKILDWYEKSNDLTREEIALEHKKFDILRAMLLINSIRLKENCNITYDEVVYIYSYTNPDVEVRARQNVFSTILKELKEERGSQLLLIPMAGDNNVTSISLLMDNYNIKKEDLPVVLINRKHKLSLIENIEVIRNYLDN